jgi:5-methylcytosine-specific restriction protein B
MENVQPSKSEPMAINQILFGPPGTGKTYNTINKSLEILGINTQGLSREIIKHHFDVAVEKGQIVFTTFHQSMAYEDFIEGIKPKTVGTNVVYEIKNGIFKKISDLAKDNYELSKNPQSNFSEVFEMLKNELAESENNELKIETKKTHFFITNITDRNIEFRKASGATNHDLVITTLKELFSGKREMQSGLAVYYYPLVEKLKEYKLASNSATLQNYILIIDEINRGNVSQIFGELITLIEGGKRLGQDETITLKLPYSQEDFVVPPNLYIIGTMNTADRSVEALDSALRRRFSFTEMLPKPELIKTNGPLKASQGILNGIDLSTVLTTINKRIEKLLDKDHQIGHSYFLQVSNLDQLKQAFQSSIIPLLQEYFFGDYGKIGLVLGQGFFAVQEATDDENFFAEFNDYELDGILDKKVYHLIDVTLLDDASFTELVLAILPRS